MWCIQLWGSAESPDHSGVVISYQFDEFTHTLSVGHFIAQSHIYSGFTGYISTLTYFLLEPDCEDYSFLDQAVKDFEHGLDSVIMDSIDTSEMHVP